MPFTVRPAQPADAVRLAEIFLQARREAFDWLNPALFRLSDFDRQTAGEEVWVAEAESGELAGFISVWVPDSFIHHLFVAPRYQGQGVGQLLLNSLDAWLPRPYSLKCLVQNKKALRFYRNKGWQPAETGGLGDEKYQRLVLS